MSNSKNRKKIELYRDEMKNDNKKIIIFGFSSIIILLVATIIITSVNNKKGKQVCDPVAIKEIEVEPKYQLINYEGFRFKMPLEWDFVSTGSNYEIADKDSKVFVSLKSTETGYQSFSNKEYQRKFLELLQTTDDIKIDNSEEKTEDNNSYILYYGTASSYNYLLVAIGNEEKTILINAKFVDKVSYDTIKEDVIKFAKSAL